MKYVSRVEYEAQVKPSLRKNIMNKTMHMLARNMPADKWRLKLFDRMGVKIGKNVQIGIDCFFDDQFPELNILGDDVYVGSRVMTIVHDDILGGARGPGDFFRLGKKHMLLGHVGLIQINRGVIIGSRSLLLAGVEVGEYSVIQAGSVVTRDVPPRCVVGGSPAKIMDTSNHLDNISASKNGGEWSMDLPAGWMTRDDYDKQVKHSSLYRVWQKILLTLARFTLPPALRSYLFRSAGARLGKHVYTGLDSLLDGDYPELIIANDESGFSIRTTFVTHGVLYKECEEGGDPQRIEYVAPIKIGARCWIGGGSVILPGVTIGEETIIGGGSVVMNDIPPRCVAVGNPAKVIKQRTL
jgi:acetyltransferase-like isoleucine patch superfamily enzyme